MKGLMNYFPGNTILHRLDPRTKILFPLMICIVCFATDNVYVLLGILMLDLMIGLIGGIFRQALRIIKSAMERQSFTSLVWRSRMKA